MAQATANPITHLRLAGLKRAFFVEMLQALSSDAETRFLRMQVMTRAPEAIDTVWNDVYRFCTKNYPDDQHVIDLYQNQYTKYKERFCVLAV